MKNAFLIIAHNEFDVLQMLISTLDDVRNDIYVHFDKKVKAIPAISTKSSKLFIIPDRVDVRWGDISQIKCEYALFQAAFENGPYDFYHIISGTHLPIKPLETIIRFYSAHIGEEVMRIWPDDPRDVRNKMRTYHFGIRYYNSKNPVIRKATQFFWRFNLAIQSKLGISRHKETSFIKSDNWLSLSQNAVSYLIKNRKKIIKKYRMSFCADEYFVATELSFTDNTFKIFNSENLLHVKFSCANANTLTERDLPELETSPCLFARKFSGKDVELLNKVKMLSYGQNN